METIKISDVTEDEFSWNPALSPAWEARLTSDAPIPVERGAAVRLEGFGPASGVWEVGNVAPNGALTLSRAR